MKIQISNFKIKFFLLFLIFLLIGVFWKVLGFNGWNFFKENPKKVIEKMVSEMENVKTSESKIEFYFNKSNGEETNLEYIANVKEDIFQKENQKTDTNFKIVYSRKEKETPLNVEYAGEKKKIGKTIYLKFTKLPEIQFFDYLSPFKNQWVKIDKDSLIESFEKILGKKITMEEEIEREEMQKDFQKELMKIFLKKEGFTIKKRLPNEKLNGKETYHYLISLNTKEFLEAFSETPKDINLKDENSPLENLKKFSEKFKNIEAEIWIGKKDFLLYKIKIDKKFTLKGEGELKLKLEIENFNYNLPVEIEAPSEYKTFDDILSSLFKGIKENLMRLKDAQIILQFLKLKESAKEMKEKENSFEELCKNKILNEENKNYKLNEIAESIKNLQGGVLKISCYSSKESFCVCVNLSKGKFCLDSSGISKEIDQGLDCLGNGTKENPYRCP
jgi:hypothetical protein